MSALSLTMVSPFPLYLDEAAGADSLAPRPTTIEGKVIGLLPNWRPSAFDLLKAVGALIARSFVEAEREAGRADEHTVWRTNRPEEIYIVVAGGQGPQDVYIGAGMPQTRSIRGM